MKSIAKVIVATIGILLGAFTIFYTPSNSWAFILSFMFGLPIIANIGAYFFIDLVYSKTKVHPIVPFFVGIFAELLLACAGIGVVMAENDGRVMACADVCSETTFANQFVITMVLAQFVFAGLFVGLIRFSILWRKDRQELPTQTPSQPTNEGGQSLL